MPKNSKLAEVDDEHRSFWRLIEHAEFAAAMVICPPDFNMASLHPSDEYTLLQAIVGASIDISGDSQKERQCVDLVAWLIKQGADPKAMAPSTCDHCQEIKCGEGFDKHSIDFAGESAISTLLEYRAVMDKEDREWGLSGSGEDSWDEELAFFNKLLDAFVKTPLGGERRMHQVDSGVLDTWDKMCHDVDSHDVVFDTSTESASAHACVLSNASPVLSAMLASKFQEGIRKRVDVRDSPVSAVRLLLELVYTGATASNLDHTSVLAAMELAHRWQMDSAVAMLERALQTVISDETFIKIAELAMLKGMPSLRNSCAAFARTSEKVQADLRSKQLPPIVQELLWVRGPPVKKRRFL